MQTRALPPNAFAVCLKSILVIVIQQLVALAALVQPMSKTTFANFYQTVALAQPIRMHQPTNANAIQIADALRTEIAAFARITEKRILANVVESGVTLQCPILVFDILISAHC